MKRATLATLVALAVLALAIGGNTVWQRRARVKTAPDQKIAGRYKFPTRGGDWIPAGDPYKAGEAVESTEAASAKVGFAIDTPKLLDAKYKPVVRLTSGGLSASVIYPNGVMLSVGRWERRPEVTNGFAEAGQTPEDYFKAYVARSAAERSKPNVLTAEVNLRPNGPYPGFEIVAGSNPSEDYAQTGAVVWAKDGIEYVLIGPADLPQEELRKIAASALEP